MAIPALISATPGVNPTAGDNGSVWSKVTDMLGFGLDVTKTVLGYNLQQNQINHGQTPSITYDTTGNPIGGAQVAYGANGKPLLASGALATAGNAFGSAIPSWMLFAIVAVLLIALLKR